MNDHEMRFRIPSSIYKRYKLICVQMDLSIPKQTSELIKKFVEIQEENCEKLKLIERNKK
jgi:hypothetical protein